MGVGLTLETAISNFKHEYLKKTLMHCQNNQTQAAKVLGIQRTYLNRLLKELGIRTVAD